MIRFGCSAPAASAASMAAMSRPPGATLVAVADADARRRPRAWPARPARRCASVDEIIADQDIDAVADRHADRHPCRPDRARRRAGKAVFCEKPVDLDVDARRGLPRRCVKRRHAADDRLQPPLRPELRRALQARLDAGEIGAVEIVTIISRDPAPPPVAYIERSGGLFRDMMIHDLDMARFLLGEEPVEVLRHGLAALVDKAIGEAGDVDTRGGAAEDRERQDRADLQLAPRHLRLRPAHRGAWLEGHDPRRQRPRAPPSRSPPRRASAPIRCRTSSSSATPHAYRARARRLHRRGDQRQGPLPAARTA